MQYLTNKNQLISKDKNLFEIILNCGSGVQIGTPQELTWYIILDKNTQVDLLKAHLERWLPTVNYFSKFNLIVGEQVVINTLGFEFTFDKISDFSQTLFDISNKFDAAYDLWEITIYGTPPASIIDAFSR